MKHKKEIILAMFLPILFASTFQTAFGYVIDDATVTYTISGEIDGVTIPISIDVQVDLEVTNSTVSVSLSSDLFDDWDDSLPELGELFLLSSDEIETRTKLGEMLTPVTLTSPVSLYGQRALKFDIDVSSEVEFTAYYDQVTGLLLLIDASVDTVNMTGAFHLTYSSSDLDLLSTYNPVERFGIQMARFFFAPLGIILLIIIVVGLVLVAIILIKMKKDKKRSKSRIRMSRIRGR
jgi:hypothetical protein